MTALLECLIIYCLMTLLFISFVSALFFYFQSCPSCPHLLLPLKIQPHYVYINSKDDDGYSDEVKLKTTEDVPKEDSTTKEGLQDEVLMAKEDSAVKEKEANKPIPSLSRQTSMEESLLCGICQVSNIHTYLYACSL